MLILSGGGDPEQVRPIDEFFAARIDKTKKVLYIPVAMEKEVFTYEQCLDWFTSTYAPFGIQNIEMLTDLSNAEIPAKTAAIFIGGGNTYKLLKELRDSGFDKKLLTFLNSGGIVYGGSAGAMIFGKTIETEIHTGSQNYGLTDLSALDQLNGYDIWCHYTPKEDPIIAEYPRPLYILFEESGLIVRNREVEPIGAMYKKSDK